MVTIYALYYAISIFTIWIGYYFRRFTLADYQYNPKLKRKRRFAIVFIYLVMALQGYVIGGRKIIIYSINDNLWVISFAFLFGFAYIFLLGRVEVPKRYPR